jgi:hypothetical protein
LGFLLSVVNPQSISYDNDKVEEENDIIVGG